MALAFFFFASLFLWHLGRKKDTKIDDHRANAIFHVADRENLLIACVASMLEKQGEKKHRVDIVVNESCACDFRTQLHGWICLLHMVKHTNMAKIINKSRNEISPIAFFTQTVIIFWLCTGDSKAAHSPTPQLQVNDRRMSNVKNTKEKETSMLFSSLVYPTKKRRKENHSTSRKTRISFH